jgi:hypothetical protein
MIRVAIQNQSTVLADGQVQAMLPALQTQVSRDFAPLWGTDAQLAFVAKGSAPPGGAWPLVVLDDSDQAGALGYHESQANTPIGFVFARSDLQAGSQVSVTASHELLEMLADPWIMSVVAVDSGGGLVGRAGTMFALEVCDAVEADQFGYTIGDVLVSNFVTPAWFGAPGSVFDFGAHCTAAFQLLAGGYIGVRRYARATEWSQVTANLTPEDGMWKVVREDGSAMSPSEIPRGSRRWRRMKQTADLAAA